MTLESSKATQRVILIYFQETWKFLLVYGIFNCQIDQGTYSNGKADSDCFMSHSSINIWEFGLYLS